MAARAILVDLDGTVWDSASWFAALLRPEGEEQELLARKLSTAGGSANVARLMRASGITENDIRAASRDAAPPTYDGALVRLAECRRQSVRVAAVTNLPRWVAEPLAESTGVSAVLDHAETARRGVPCKPKPNLLVRALSALQAAPPDALMIGDSMSDWQAATSLDVRFIWANWGYGGSPPDGVRAADSWAELDL